MRADSWGEWQRLEECGKGVGSERGEDREEMGRGRWTDNAFAPSEHAPKGSPLSLHLSPLHCPLSTLHLSLLHPHCSTPLQGSLCTPLLHYQLISFQHDCVPLIAALVISIMSLLQAVQQHHQQQQQQPHQASPTFSATNSPSDFLTSSHKRSRSNDSDLPEPPPPPPPVLSHPSHLPLTSPSPASLFGDDAVFAGLLESASFTSRPPTFPSPSQSPSDFPPFLPCEFSHPPLDWGLHSHLRFHSPNPPPPLPSQADQATALRAFILRSIPSPPASSPLTPATAFASSLYFYLYPPGPLNDLHPLTSHLLNAQSTPAPTPYDKRCLSFASQRWSDWEQSFRSLYFQLRSHHLHHFYLTTPTHTALFLASTSPTSPPAAIISRCPAHLKASLTALGVKFTSPYAKTAPPVAVDEGVGRLPKGVRVVAKGGRGEEGGLASLLVVSGREDVHGLYDCLLNAERRGGEDVPTLLSSSPFLHGMMRGLTVTRGGGGDGGDKWTVDVRGWILPEALMGMMEAMNGVVSEGAEWGVKLWKDEEGGTSSNLNSVMSIASMGDYGRVGTGSEGRQCVALCHDEQVHAALLRTVGSTEVCPHNPHASTMSVRTAWNALLMPLTVFALCVDPCVAGKREPRSVRNSVRRRSVQSAAHGRIVARVAASLALSRWLSSAGVRSINIIYCVVQFGVDAVVVMADASSARTSEVLSQRTRKTTKNLIAS